MPFSAGTRLRSYEILACTVPRGIEAMTKYIMLAWQVDIAEDYKPADMPNWLQYRQKYHTTPTQLAEIANQTQPGVLIVYHRGVGPPGREISDEQYLAEIRRTYRGRVVIGQDLDVYRM